VRIDSVSLGNALMSAMKENRILVVLFCRGGVSAEFIAVAKSRVLKRAKMNITFSAFLDPRPETLAAFKIEKTPKMVLAFNKKPWKAAGALEKEDITIQTVPLAIEYEPMYNWFQEVRQPPNFKFIFNVKMAKLRKKKKRLKRERIIKWLEAEGRKGPIQIKTHEQFQSIHFTDYTYIIGLFEGDSSDLEYQLDVFKREAKVWTDRPRFIAVWIDGKCHPEILETLNKKTYLPTVMSYNTLSRQYPTHHP
jgi:hypothetical protein